MTDKAKQTASNIFAKTKTQAFRITQKVMVKVGKAEETVDIQFNQEAERFKVHYKAVKKMKNDTVHFLQVLRDLSISQAQLCQNMYEMYDTKAANYNACLKNQDIAKMVDNSRIAFDEQLRADYLDPISKYLGQFKEAKNRINERNTRLVDMDRYGRDLKILQEKASNQSKITVAQQKYEAAKTNYSTLNEELLKDLPRLYEDRIPFFDPLLATYSTGLAEYYRQGAKATAEITNLVAHIDRQKIHQHERVITPIEASSAKFKATVAHTPTSINNAQDVYGGDSGGDHHDPYAQHGDPYSQPQYTASAPPQSGPPSVPKKATPALPNRAVKAKALFDFNPQEANELGFKFNDVLVIHNMKGDWWEGELNGRRGLLPSNYVQLLE